MGELFYNFQMGEQNRGYYYLRHEATSILSYTRFFIGESEIFINIFRLKVAGDKVVSFQYHSDPWVDFMGYPDDHYPSSAYPLFIEKALSEPYRYTAVYEGDNSILGETLLTPQGNEILETRDGQLMRRFTMQGATPTAIDWGGPVSHLCANAEAAIAGSGLDFIVS
ncbi:MAG: hypothetical protein AAF614_39505 [Chloroflexota bacterium]